MGTECVGELHLLMKSNDQPKTEQAPKWSLLFELLLVEGQRLGAVASELGLTASQAHLLWRLSPDASVPMSALAAALSCDNSNVTGLVDRLEAQEFLVRETGRDRRVKTISLTAKGRRARTRIIERLDVAPPPIASLSEQEQRRLFELIVKALGARD